MEPPRREAVGGEPSVVGRCQLGGELGELGRCCRCPTGGGMLGGRLQFGGDSGVRTLGGEREVARPFLDVGDDSGERAVHGLASPQRRLLVADGGEQRMGEANARAVEHDHVLVAARSSASSDAALDSRGPRPRRCRPATAAATSRTSRVCWADHPGAAEQGRSGSGKPQRPSRTRAGSCAARAPGRALAQRTRCRRRLVHADELGSGQFQPEPALEQLVKSP